MDENRPILSIFGQQATAALICRHFWRIPAQEHFKHVPFDKQTQIFISKEQNNALVFKITAT